MHLNLEKCPVGRQGWVGEGEVLGVTDATKAGTLFASSRSRAAAGCRGRRQPRRSDPRLTPDLARRLTSNCDKAHMVDNYSE